MMLRPWMAEAPNRFDNPKIDFTRFNLPYWRKWERMLRYARDRDVILSAILEISTHKAQPVAGARTNGVISATPSRACPLSRILRGTWEMVWTVSGTRNG